MVGYPNRFPVHHNWSETSPKFRPQIIDYFSLDRKRQIFFDSSQLSYLYHRSPSKDVNFDLNEGMGQVQRRTHDPEKLDNLLRWINKNSHKILANPDSGRWLKPNFICHPGLLRKIIATPYDLKTRWIICAAKWNGNIYMCLLETKEEKENEKKREERDWEMISWGHKFEQYMVSDSPDQPPDTSKAVCESEEFNCVFQSQLLDHHLLYAAKMDALISDKKLVDPLPLDQLKFVELTTRRSNLTFQQNKDFKKFKTLNWWSQCYLAGTDRIICGERNDDGIVKEIKHYLVDSLPIDYSFKNYWHPSEAMNFCDAFLKYVEQRVVHDYDHTIYKFERIPLEHIVLTTESPSSENNLLPDWYIRHEPSEKSKSEEESEPVEKFTSVKKPKSDEESEPTLLKDPKLLKNQI